MLNFYKKSKKGFTLIELIVVVAIIGILMAILIPSLIGYITSSKIRQVEANAKTAFNAIYVSYNESSTEDGFVMLSEDVSDIEEYNVLIDKITTEDGVLGTSWKGKVGIAVSSNSNKGLIAIWSKDKNNSIGTSKNYNHASGTGEWAAYPMETEWAGDIYFGTE